MRKNPRPHLALAILGSFTAAMMVLAGCSNSGGGSGPTVAMVTPESTGEFYGAMYCGAKAASAEQGVTLNIQGTPEVTVEAEMQVLQSVLATEPDGMLLTVWDNEAFNGIMGQYTSKGHPLVMPDSMLNSGDYLQSIRTDNYKSSYDAALEAVKAYGVKAGKVLIATDAPGNEIQSARAEGFRDAIQKNTGLQVLQFQYVGGDSAKASAAVTSAAAANPDLALVFSTNIGAGTGSANGISTAGRDVVHVGYDTSAAQVEQLKKGDYDALVAQSPYQMGYDAMTVMSKVLKGETDRAKVTEQTVWSPWVLVTAKNVDDPSVKPFLYTSDCSKVI
jgi:ribose transport system substrate-binding protein